VLLDGSLYSERKKLICILEKHSRLGLHIA